MGKRAEPVPAKAARDYLRGLVVGKNVGIRRIEDRYGRTVAELFVGETNVGQEMVGTGHAEIYWVSPSMSLDGRQVIGPA